MNDQTFTPDQAASLQRLANLLSNATQKETPQDRAWHPDLGWQPRAKAVSTTASSIYGHGPGGLFSSPALEQPVFTAMVLPRNGLQDVLPVFPSNTMNPLYGLFTGVTATTGSEATGPCDDPPVAGTSKLCMHSFVFSQRMRQTPVINILDVGRISNRGEHFDLQFLGSPFVDGTKPNVPTAPTGINPNEVLRTEQAKRMFELAVTFSRDLAVEFYTGNPTGNSAGGGNQYFYGLDILINTGYKDAITGIACPAADSIVESFGSVDFTVGTNGASFVRKITSMWAALQMLSVQVGLAPVQWALTMPSSMFYELVRIYPLQYNTLFNQTALTGTSNLLYVDGTEMAKMRTDMMGDIANRTGQYLIIDNARVPVILDDGIVPTVSAGGAMTASLYFVPLTVLGGRPATYMEYFDWTAPGAAMDFARAFGNNQYYNVSDNGRFFWHFKPPSNFCVQMLAVLRARLMLLTPHLAARLTNVKYTPSFYPRGWNTADSSFYVNGGSQSLNGLPAVPPSFYAPN